MNYNNKILLTFTIFILSTITTFLYLPKGYSTIDSLRIQYHRIVNSKNGGNGKFEKVELLIGDKSLRKLEESRVLAINRGCLLDSFQYKTKAKLMCRGVKHDVKVKLKGTLASHWIEPLEWSFRVSLEKDTTVFNDLRIFSLQSRNQRGVYADYYYHKVLNLFNVINLKYEYVEMYVNGIYLENYTVEEFFDSPLISRNNRPAGLIFKFDSDRLWEISTSKDYETKNFSFDLYEDMYSTAPLKFYKNRFPKNEKRSNDIEFVKKTIDSFKKEEKLTHEIFDISTWGAYFAVNTLFANQHPARLTNLRFYFNPETRLIEPIGYDLEHINSLTKVEDYTDIFWVNENRNEVSVFYRQLFSDSLMMNSYILNLQEIVNSKELDLLLISLKKETDSIIFDQKDTAESRFYIRENINIISAKLANGF
tara:strand:+ start:1095 stop:2360 length:1266 start_codon:yes stop_codon:yes gene_type:complete